MSAKHENLTIFTYILPKAGAPLWIHISEHTCVYTFVFLFCVCAHCLTVHKPLIAQPSESTPSFDLPLICQLVSTSIIHPSVSLPLLFLRHFLSLSSLLFCLFLLFQCFLFPAHPIWSSTLHSCSPFNEDLSPSHARACTRYSDTSHTQLQSAQQCARTRARDALCCAHKQTCMLPLYHLELIARAHTGADAYACEYVTVVLSI